MTRIEKCRIADCSQAVKLGPSPNATAATGGEQLGKDRTISDYYAERGFAYLKKDDYIHALVDLVGGVDRGRGDPLAVRVGLAPRIGVARV